MAVRDEVTRILSECDALGREQVVDQLFRVVYPELRAMASGLMRGERRSHTLQATALVNEAYLRLVDQDRVEYNGKTHFVAVASLVMRRLLKEYARTRGRLKRGGDGWQRVSLSDGMVYAQETDVDVERLADALDSLAEQDARKAEIVQMKFFGGMTTEEVAAHFGVSARTVEREWRFSRAWLVAELGSPSLD